MSWLKPIRVMLLVVGVVQGRLWSGKMACAEAFDQPVRTTVVDLGWSPNQPDYPNLHVHLSCFYYPRFMVKQLTDDGNKGALWYSIVRMPSGTVSKCVRTRRRAEMAFGRRWGGYFKGVKGNLIFLDGDDGLGPSYYFAVFDSKSGRELWKDEYLVDTSIDVVHGTTLRYQRTVAGDCSLMKEGVACWNKLKRRTGLGAVPMPGCKGYDAEGVDSSDPSVISYAVEVALFPAIRRKPVAGPVGCWAGE